jgi:hypothetical protein
MRAARKAALLSFRSLIRPTLILSIDRTYFQHIVNVL